ncbi:hypothetical protein N7478_009106 [Penicillium angulare]|uniref:uncharacterized protein n=1 Tax=Penicillium angulare TaxID=116970 RepID=UPI002540C4C8|nr:uncharacterized protein N7478_009106 [Penicillium angulare]KAJ5273981.1 hypothetical protein N7478_009106 [Penicillium angulare]
MSGVTDVRKSILITGCSPGGIGNSLAREFQRQGLRVLATARKTETISDLSDLGIETLNLEVDNLESVKACYAEVETRLDYTVPAMEVELEEARLTFEVNLFSVINMCQTFMPLLINAKGTIVQVGSVTAVVPYVFGSVYNASKAALQSFSDTLRLEVAPLGVHVTTIVTGGVSSRIARTERQLKPDSLYRDIEDKYLQRVVHSQHNAMSHDEYAQSVVIQILYGSAPWRWINPWAQGRKLYIWEGRLSWVIWLAAGGWIWIGIFGMVLSHMFQLGRIKPRQQKVKAK